MYCIVSKYRQKAKKSTNMSTVRIKIKTYAGTQATM